MNVYYIIVAAGSGSRFGGGVPKQFRELSDRPVLMHTIDAFLKVASLDKIIIVLNEGCIDLWQGLCRKFGFTSPMIVSGGETRWQSVKNAIEMVPTAAELISVHDGARPLVDASLIERTAKKAYKTMTGCVPVVPVTDSLRRIGENGESYAVERKEYAAVQTPQIFNAEVLRESYSRPYRESFTDDASVVEDAGYLISTVEGNASNIKITNPFDLELAKCILNGTVEGD